MTRQIEPIAAAIEIHRRQIERHEGADGIRDKGLLEASLAQSWQGFGDIGYDDPLAFIGTDKPSDA
ncbi:hypothetical protein [Raoultibacter timonensis]|uniref:hypothetical protein n=1 Tax=Raoultibacter timonensis TaxID=1907662 RepID=UPI0026DD9E37|nr:hypothetical protein [Raoultibacter timonensis]